MPQMAPIYWLLMLLFFSASFMFFLIMNYFISSSEKMEAKDIVFDLKKKNWKW